MEEGEGSKISSRLRLRLLLRRTRSQPHEDEDESESEDSVESDDPHIPPSVRSSKDIDPSEVLQRKEGEDQRRVEQRKLVV